MQSPVRPGVFFLGNVGELLLNLHGFFVSLRQFVDFSGEVAQARLHDFVSDLFFIEGDHFLNRADALLQVLAHGEQFANHDGRSRKRLEHAVLSTLNPLGDFNFTFASQERNCSHLAQIHADGVVGFFHCPGSEVEFDVLPELFCIFAVESSGGQFWALQYINALRTNGG